MQHQRVQRRTRAIELVETCEQGGEAFRPRDPHRDHFVVPEARAVQIPEPQHRGDHHDDGKRQNPQALGANVTDLRNGSARMRLSFRADQPSCNSPALE